jgi:hypothetical protein
MSHRRNFSGHSLVTYMKWKYAIHGGIWMRRLALLIVLCSALAIAGCSAGSSKSEMAAVSPAAPEMSGPAAAADSSLRTAEAKQSSAAGSASNAGTAQQPAAAQITAADQAGFQASDTADGLNRKIMYKANLVMKTDNYVDASEQIQNKVALSGGYILQFNENVTQHERGGTFTIKVPSSGFSSLLKELENISPATQRSVQGQDVSEEYVDLTSRMKAKQVVEARLLEFMGKAAKILERAGQGAGRDRTHEGPNAIYRSERRDVHSRA